MSTTINAAIVALYDLLQVSPPTDVSVYDGDPGEDGDYIAVGYSPAGPNVVDFEYEWRAIGQRKQEESYGIVCTILSTSGDDRDDPDNPGTGGVRARRVRVEEIRNHLATVLGTHPTLNGTVRLAAIAGGSLFQGHTKQGLGVGMTLTVACQVRITN